MMRPAFFRTPGAARILERAARAAAAPVAVHFLDEGREGARIAGSGSCAACRIVDQLPGGHDACRASRAAAAVDALRLVTSEAFVCHMGFACVTVPVFDGGPNGFVLTLGPFNPSDATEAMAADARIRYEEFGGDPDEFPLPLDDIRAVPVETVAEIAVWTVESLQALTANATDEFDEDDNSVTAKPTRRKRKTEPAPDELDGHAIARALATGDTAHARKLVKAVLAESHTSTPADIQALRARCVAVTAAAVEAASAAGMAVPHDTPWLERLHRTVGRAETAASLTNAAMTVLKPLAAGARKSPRSGAFAAVDAYVLPRIREGVTARDVAAHLGLDPSAISHRIRRTYGMTFTEYLGRLRVDQAKDLLRRTRLNLTEVGRRVGVTDPSNFNRLFRKFERMSPSEYRKRFGKTP